MKFVLFSLTVIAAQDIKKLLDIKNLVPKKDPIPKDHGHDW